MFANLNCLNCTSVYSECRGNLVPDWFGLTGVSVLLLLHKLLQACTEAQILTGYVVQQLETPEDITDLLKTYTKAVAEKPAKYVQCKLCNPSFLTSCAIQQKFIVVVCF